MKRSHSTAVNVVVPNPKTKTEVHAGRRGMASYVVDLRLVKLRDDGIDDFVDSHAVLFGE